MVAPPPPPAPSRSGSRPCRSGRRACRPPPIPPTRWRRPSGWRCNPTLPGSANITAPSPATPASAWSTPSRRIRSSKAAGRAACSIRRSARCWPRPRGGGRRASAGRSSPIPSRARGSAFPQNSCRSRPATPTAPNGARRPAPRRCLLTRRKEAGPTTVKLAEREKKEAGRTVDYTVVKPDFFVLSGLQGLKKFYLRGSFKGDEVRILTILYDQAVENTVEPVVIAMSSAFTPFPIRRGTGDAQDRRLRHRHRRFRRRRDPRRSRDHRQLHGDHDRRAWQRRRRGRRQGSRAGAAARLWRARIEAARACRWRGKGERRSHRRSPIRRARVARRRQAA